MTKKLHEGNILEIIVDVTDEKEVIKLFKFLKKIGKVKSHKIMITTAVPMVEFYVALGKGIANSTQFSMELPEVIMPVGDTTMHEMMGRVALDTFIPQTYFIKSEANMTIYEIREV